MCKMHVLGIFLTLNICKGRKNKTLANKITFIVYIIFSSSIIKKLCAITLECYHSFYLYLKNSMKILSNSLCIHRHVQLYTFGDIITYLVSYRRSIEIWRVCKIYGRRGGAEPSIYFTNPPYFYRPSGTDQISVLFRRGPWIVYAVTKIRQKSTQAAYIYGRDLRAKMWRYDLRGGRHKRRCENKRTTRRFVY